jgi:hypothetical protein
VTVASDIWMVLLSSLVFYFCRRVKWFWVGGCLGTVLLTLGCGLLDRLGRPAGIKYLLLANRHLFILCTEVVLYNYLARVMPTKGYNFCYCLFFLFGYVNSQVYLPLAQVAYSVPFFLYSAVTLATLPFFLLFMKEAD